MTYRTLVGYDTVLHISGLNMLVMHVKYSVMNWNNTNVYFTVSLTVLWASEYYTLNTDCQLKALSETVRQLPLPTKQRGSITQSNGADASIN